jgi:hypothetical protein
MSNTIADSGDPTQQCTRLLRFMFVYIEPTDPTNPDSPAQARLAFTREEAEYHSPFVLPFEEFMGKDDMPPLTF